MSDVNDDPVLPPGDNGDDGDSDTPIRELRELERETTPGFLARVRRTIHRRTAVSHVATFSWQLPKLVLVELAGMLVHILNAVGPAKRSEPRKGSER